MRIHLDYDGDYNQDDAALRQWFVREVGAKTQRATRNTMNQAKTNAPVDVGTLRNSHRQDPVRIAGWIIDSAVAATARHALWVHEGTGPHPIRPRTKKVLSWKGPGGRVFARSVMHPGTTARPWLLNAARVAAGAEGFSVIEF